MRFLVCVELGVAASQCICSWETLLCPKDPTKGASSDWEEQLETRKIRHGSAKAHEEIFRKIKVSETSYPSLLLLNRMVSIRWVLQPMLSKLWEEVEEERGGTMPAWFSSCKSRWVGSLLSRYRKGMNVLSVAGWNWGRTGDLYLKVSTSQKHSGIVPDKADRLASLFWESKGGEKVKQHTRD